MPNVAAAENAALRFSRGLSFVTSLSWATASVRHACAIARQVVKCASPYLKSTTPGFSLSTM